MLGPTSALLLLSVAGPPAVEWRAPKGCPTRADVLDALGALTRPPDLEGVRVRGSIRRVGKRYELRLDIHTRRLTQRRVEQADACDALDGAAALIIAIAVDPSEFVNQIAPPAEAEAPPADVPPVDVPPPLPEPEPAPPAPEPEPPAPEPAPPVAEPEPPAPAPADKPARRRQAVGFVRVEGALDAGATQTIGGDVGGAVGLFLRRLRLEAVGHYLPARPLHFEGERVGTMSRWALGVRVCGRFVRGTLEIPLCGGAEGGQFLATGAGITVRVQDARPPWFALILGLGLTWSPHPRVGLGARTELIVVPYRAVFTVSDRNVFVSQPVGVRFGGGLEIRFGAGARRDGSTPARPK